MCRRALSSLRRQRAQSGDGLTHQSAARGARAHKHRCDATRAVSPPRDLTFPIGSAPLTLRGAPSPPSPRSDAAQRTSRAARVAAFCTAAAPGPHVTGWRSASEPSCAAGRARATVPRQWFIDVLKASL